MVGRGHPWNGRFGTKYGPKYGPESGTRQTGHDAAPPSGV